MATRKLTRDEERFKTCLKKSKSKTIHRGENSSGQMFWYFQDVDQTGWHHGTIGDLIADDFITIDFMSQNKYSGITWNSTNS